MKLLSFSAISNLVPTPSVAETSKGLTKFFVLKLKTAPKPPNPPKTSLLSVLLTKGFISSIILFPKSILIPDFW